MKVLKKGNPNPPKWEHQVECYRCSALLGVTDQDVKWQGDFRPRYTHDVDGDLVWEDFQVICPECQTPNSVDVVLPSKIKSRLRPDDI